MNEQVSLNAIKDEIIYYHIPDQLIQCASNNGIMIEKRDGENYCYISMRQLFQLFPKNSRINITYTCEQCNTIHTSSCRAITKKLEKTDGHFYCAKCMKKYTVAKHTINNIVVSSQQQYFYNLLINTHKFKNAQINYIFDQLSIDIAIPDKYIGIEYNGGGHDLSVKLKSNTPKQFIRKEWKRRLLLSKNNWKMIYIVAQHDKISNYTDDEYISILQYAYNLLSFNDWVEIYIEEDRILTHNQLIYIHDVLSKNIRPINIFSLKRAIKYLHISTKTFYKAKIPVNITPYNFRYYTQEQLDEYINSYGKIGNNYLLTKEAAEYLHTSVNKVKLLQDIKQLYPYVINDEYYFHIKQLDQCMQSHILDNYFSTDDAVKYLAKYNINKVVHTLRNDNNLPAMYIINQQKFYTKEQLDEYIAKQQYISSLYTRKQAAEYLHMSLATLDRKEETGELVPVEKGYLYSKKQLDEYMINNGIDINSNYLSLNEVFDKYSTKYNFSKRQLKRLVENGKVATKMIARKHYICENDIEQYLQSLQIDEKYMSRSDILAKYNITKGQLRYAVENKKIGIIKQGSKMLYNSDDVLIYTNMLCARDNNQYLNTEESLKYLNINAKSLYSLQELNILLPDCQKLHRKYYSVSTLDNFLKNKDNILINIQNAYRLIKNSKCNNINELINKCDYLNSVVIQRFTYIKCEDFFNIINPYIPMHRIDNNMHQFYIQNNIYPIYYQNQCYILEYQYIHLRNKLIKQLVTILSLYNKNKTIFMLQQYNNLYTTKQAAIYLNISQSKLYYLLQMHKIFGIKTADNTYITFDELQRYKNENNSNGLISFNETLKYLHISHNTLEKKLKQFNIPIVKIINNKRFFSKKDIDGLL